MPPSRRDFLAAVPASVVGAAVAAGRTPTVDAHVHCFAGPADKAFPTHKNAPYTPDAATPEHLLKCMDAAAVDYAVIVHPEPYQDDHSYLEHVLKVGKGRLKGTCLFFAGSDELAERLKDLAKRTPLVAARIHAYVPERLPPFGKPALTELWKAAADAALAVQLHFAPEYAEGFEPLIKDFKDVRVIVDHLGRPMQGTADDHARVVAWGKLPNVVMKVSELPDATADNPRDLRDVLKQLLDAFGPDRLITGGGFDAKATGESYKAERGRVAELLAGLNDADRAKVMGGTAAMLFGFAG